jgi:hypothetical protein
MQQSLFSHWKDAPHRNAEAPTTHCFFIENFLIKNVSKWAFGPFLLPEIWDKSLRNRMKYLKELDKSRAFA